MKTKLKWKVEPAPTGLYRSFYKRDWPTAEYSNGDIAFAIYSVSEYIPANVKTGKHEPLRIRIADYTTKPVWVWRTLKKRATTLAEAKQIAQDFIDKNPEFKPSGV